MIRVDFRCENCRVEQRDIVVEPDSTVQCSDCEHVVDVGVYLGPAEIAELLEERDPEVPFSEEVPPMMQPDVLALSTALNAAAHRDPDNEPRADVLLEELNKLGWFLVDRETLDGAITADGESL